MATAKEHIGNIFNAYGFKGFYDGQQMMYRINALPSAEAEWIPLNTKEEKNMITLIEMQDVLGKQIEKCTDEHLTAETRALVFDQAKNVAKLAKQVINNADIILRADKMSARHDRIDRVVGE